MTTTVDPVPGNSPSHGPSVAPPNALLWSIRRELWEHRTVVWGLPATASLLLLGFLILILKLPPDLIVDFDDRRRSGAALLLLPLAAAPLVLFIVQALIAAIYASESLHGERRDRSLLFWKSLPVSDAQTVLSKALVPLIVLPLYSLLITLTTELLMFGLASLRLIGSDETAGAVLASVPLATLIGVVLAFVPAFVLVVAPFYAWLMLVSGWARRSPMTWAILLPLLLGMVERASFGTTWLLDVLTSPFRLLKQAFIPPGHYVDADAVLGSGPALACGWA